MKFICDVHIPIRLSKFLVSKGFESVHVNQILDGSSTSDGMIGQYADANDYIVITKDADFRNSYFTRKTPRKLIRVCLGNVANEMLMQLIDRQITLITQLNQENVFYLEINVDSVLLY